MFRYYTLIILITMVSMLILSFMTIRNTVIRLEKRKYFVTLFWLTTLGAGMEWVSFWIEGLNNDLLLWSANLLYFMIPPLLGFILGGCMGNIGRMRSMMVLYVFYLMILFSSIATNVIFGVNEQGYFRGTGYWVYIIMYMISIFYALVETLCMMKQRGYHGKRVLGLTLLFLLAGTSIQVIWPEWKCVWLTIGITMHMYYSFYNELCRQMDPITGLLNRGIFDRNVKRLKENCVIIQFQIEDLQLLNQKLGYMETNDYLTAIGKGILSLFQSYGRCYRVSGTSFFVVMTQNIGNEEKLIRAFDDQLKEARRTDYPMMPTIYHTYATWKPNGTESLSEMFKRMQNRLNDEQKKSG